MTKALAAKTVLETVLEWSNKRPVWQRDALRRIVNKGKLDDTDIADLVFLCKQGKGGTAPGAKPDPFQKAHLPANPSAGASVSLLSVKDVDGANALAPAQTLPFAPSGITVIYGDNGAGKSGYARILKHACRARCPGEIHGNIYDVTHPSSPATATIEYAIGGQAQPPEKWQKSEHLHSTLSAVSVFDSDCASIHIGSKNEVAFRPFGLDVPDELASACQRVKEALVTEKKQLETAKHHLLLKPSWKDTTTVGKALATLKHDTDFAKLTGMATLKDADRARLSQLKEDLSKDPAKAAAEQKAKANNIKDALAAIALIEAATTDKALSSIFTIDRDAKAKRAAARVAGENAFSSERITGIGSETWRALWEAARRYSTETAYHTQPFPAIQDDVLCVLCQQPLQDDAKERLTRFEKFIQEDTERHAEAAEKLAKASLKKLATQSISLRPIAANLREIVLQDTALAKQARRFIASARLRRYALLKQLTSSEQQPILPVTAANPKTATALIEARIREYAEDLQKSANGEERKNLETELAELSDRATIHEVLQIVKQEIDRLKAIYFLDQCLEDTSTNAITKIGNDIADTLITPQLRDRFQQEIIKLAADKVRVEIVRSGGRFGSPQYQVRFFAKPDAKVADVLSEGEKTCVALAAFLTELATATHRSTLVFDDPVSSLDHRWRKQVAKRLVEEANNRQIIVFTHDLVFVNDLLDLAQGLPTQFLTVSRERLGAGIVSDGLPWKAKSVEDRLDKLEKGAREAKKLYEANDEEKYASAAAQVYSHLRATWERAIEEIAFFKIVRRHRDYIDTKHLKKATVLTDADCDAFHAGFKKCCDVTDAHDPSIGRNAEPPPPGELLQDVKALTDWVTSIRDRQKKIQ